jgi:Arc/MetJ family transcription regulator
MGRTNIVLDSDLVRRTKRVTGARSTREAVDIALRHLVEQAALFTALRKLKGKIRWEGDLDRWRRNRP